MRERTTNLLRRCALASLGATIVLVPFRYRLVLVPRPYGMVYHDYTDLLLFASEVTLLATLGFWCAALMLSRAHLCRGPAFLSTPLAGLTALSAVSIVTSVDPLLSQVLIATGHARRLSGYTLMCGIAMTLSVVGGAVLDGLRGVSLVWMVVYPMLSVRLLTKMPPTFW